MLGTLPAQPDVVETDAPGISTCRLLRNSATRADLMDALLGAIFPRLRPSSTSSLAKLNAVAVIEEASALVDM